MNHDVEHNKDSASSIDRRLSEMHQSIQETQHAIRSQPEIFRHIFKSISPYDRQLQPIGERPSVPWYPSSGIFVPPVRPFSSQSHDRADSLEILPAASPAENNQGKVPELDYKNHVTLRSHGSFVTCEPTSSFEASSNFFPELYTTGPQLLTSSLIVTSSKEAYSSIHSRINYYRVIYLKSPRQWSRLNISIEFCSSSRYWAATELSRHGNISPGHFTPVCSLPQSLLKQVQDYLSEADDHQENANIQLCLSAEDIIQKQQSQHRRNPLQSSLMTAELPNIVQSILIFLDDLGCQRYCESQIIQVGTLQPPIHFASLINGILVCETKFAHNCPSHKDLYNIQVLRGMDGIPGFAKLVGIVVDQSGKHLKSYLIEFPHTKWDFISDLVTKTNVIPWERREKWARQVVEGVCQIHCKTFVVGTLSRGRTPIIVDSYDRVQFWSFEKQFVLGSGRDRYYPPEYAHFKNLSPSTSEAECPSMTQKADIFFLGMVLCNLAMGYPAPRSSPVRMGEKQRLTIPFELFEQRGLDDPTALPSLPDSIPKYYRDIIDECRSVVPNDRPAAWRLLERFPAETESAYPGVEDSRPGSINLSSLIKLFGVQICCNYCKNGAQEFVFHCNICDDGDFDICLRCYNQGLHCYEGDHLLIEMELTESQGWIVTKRYHSGVRRSGKRDIVEL